MILLMDNQDQSQELSAPEQNSPPKLFSILSNNKYIIIFIVILSILSLGSTSYLLIANKKKTPVPKIAQENTVVELPSPTLIPIRVASKPTITPTPTPTLSAVADPSASWSAFVSVKYVYSIKYPPDWTAKITTQTDPKILEYVVFNEVSTKAGTLSITLSYGTRTNKEALALDPQIGESLIVASVGATKKNTKDSNGNKATNVIVPFGSNTIIFNAKDAFSSLFNQMLTTLKLTK